MARYERQTAKGVEYIELAIDGKTVRTKTGRVGGKPKITRAKYPSEFAAASRFRRAIPTAKGFVHVSTLRATQENLELECAIVERPDDRSVREVYGDWLLERGDPRGELIAIQREVVATGAKAAARRKRQRALLAKHSSLLFGRLDEIVDVPAYHDYAPHVLITWNLGFFDAIDLRLPVELNLDRRFKRVEVPTLAEAIGLFAQHPSARFLRRISLWPEADRGVIRALSALPRTLRSVKIWFDWMQRVPDLSELCAAHCDLEQLTLRLSKQPLVGLELPNLRELEVQSSLTPGHVDAIARAKWLRLHTLAISLGGENSAKPQHFDTLLTGANVPALTTLRLGGAPDEAYATELAKRAARHPTLATIELVNFHPPSVVAFERALATPRISVKTIEVPTQQWGFCDPKVPGR